jgi:hypothetical protein
MNFIRIALNYFNNTGGFHMKNFICFAVILIASLFIFTNIISAGEITVKNRANMAVGKIEAGGIVRDSFNMIIGKVESDGTVKNTFNLMIGKIESDGTVKDRFNMKTGKIEKDGTVINRAGILMGKIANDGSITDKFNSRIGSLQGYTPSDLKTAAGCYFFFFFD